ncbi:MAG: hypothetical protein GQ549_01725, partial [Gammaproteobacteria bacterium]|nr:hypothetical protein [Gammaproteobacteria bacterium]
MLIKKKLTKLFVAVMLSAIYCEVVYADYDADNLINLFTDKSQRARIDAARSGQASPESQKTNKVTVEGYVTRSDGKSVVWVNNRNTLEGSKIGDVKVHQNSIGKNKKVTI